MSVKTTPRILLQGGHIVAGPDRRQERADVLIEDGRIVAVEPAISDPGAEVIDCRGRVCVPGFIDAHSHAAGALFDEAVQRANLRQGVTTVVIGQDGVGAAPGDGQYAREYFGVLDGVTDIETDGSVAGLLRAYDETTRVNVGYVIPAGTVRHCVMGSAEEPASPAQRRQMVALVREGMQDGALGLSTGLDYVPGMFADADEIAALTVPVAEADGVHVSHMRHGYESAVPDGFAELRAISDISGVRTHVSHLHGPADTVIDALDRFGQDWTFDMYPYRRGCTLLGMPLLPGELMAQGNAAVLAVLEDPSERATMTSRERARIESRPDMGPAWAENTRLVHVGAAQLAWASGLTVAAAAAREGYEPLDFAYHLLAESALQATAVIANPTQRPIDDLARIFRDHRHVAGSDGIYIGSHPHPRGWGTFARFLRQFTRERADYTLPEAVGHLSTRAATALGLGLRGRIEPGWHADIAVIDPATVADRADYDRPRQEAVGVSDVIVAGQIVLRDGELTSNMAGRGIHRERVALMPAPVSTMSDVESVQKENYE